MAKKTLEPQQARSRESSRKLLKAAAEVLGQHGLEGTTIPRIARHAGLTPGSIYRRFHDKEELLETVILGILERQDERLHASLTPEMARQIPLPVFADQIINGMVVSYRMSAPLLHALRQFVQGRANTPFWHKAARLEVRTCEHLVDLIMTHRKEISHPDPRTAVSLALMMVTSTLFELVVAPTDLKLWKNLLPKDDQELRHELVRAFLNYLGVEQKRA
ncbi:MAG TPA: TetR/AcrR family transcriptional regulator [Candidatus Angelobacter sp.]|nr:TetR/AcrR family transcriptional regulator [Candidatus Angelobacter sp.]